MLKLLVSLLAALLLLLAFSVLAWGSEPSAAQPYKAYLKQHALVVWGSAAPIPLFAGQIQQESAWNPTARSAYACGLTQFTPDTVKWIAEQYKVDVGSGECTDPRWAIRAMLRYDKHLADAIAGADGECSNHRFMLSAYNGGLGWVIRDRALAAKAGFNPGAYEEVKHFNAGRAPAFFLENRTYPARIVQHQLVYQTWGGPLTCKELIDATIRSESVVPKQPAVDPWRCAGVDRWLCKLAPLRNGA